MFGIGSTEFLVILLVALLVLGPKNLAKAASTVGKYMGEFRRVSTDFQRTLNAEVAEDERREAEARRKAAPAKEPAKAPEASGQAAGASEPKAKVAEVAETPAAEAAPVKEAEVVGKAAEEVLAPPPPGSPLEAALRRAQEEAGTAPKAEPAAPKGGQA